jgi:hypothetical protein
MKWEKFDHTHLYPDGEYVVEIDGRRNAIVNNETEHDGEGWFNVWVDDNGFQHEPSHFTRIFRLDLADTPTAVEQANAFLDARFDTIN